MNETIVISLGGSVVVPEKVDVEFLKALKKIIVGLKEKVIIVIGGGATCRNYIHAAQQISKVSADDLDWIGIAATRLNAELVRSVFGDSAYNAIVTNPTKKIVTRKIIIAAGWKPGWSTDHDAVLLAKTYGAKTVINMTNVDYLYDKNPKEYADARKIERSTWERLQSIVGTEWTPGLNKPFDPVATALAARLKLKLIIIGPDIKNLENVLADKAFKGTVIS